MKRWWKWALAALAALLAILARRGNPWRSRAADVERRAEQAGHQAIRERAEVAEKEVQDELASKRAAAADDRLRDALRRARDRRVAAGRDDRHPGAG